MKILIVAMAESIHTARWISQLAGQGFEIHLFSSAGSVFVHPALENVTVYTGFHLPNKKAKNIVIKGRAIRSKYLAILLQLLSDKLFPGSTKRRLEKLVKELKPDVIHSLEIQHAGYLVEEVKNGFEGQFPKWIVTNWGSDIYYFGRFPEHEKRIGAVLKSCDLYSCECQRDVALARVYGFGGKVLPIFPNAGGLDLEKIDDYKSGVKVSSRKVIAVKGYQTWAGRALTAVKALELCADVLHDYKIIFYSVIPRTGVRDAINKAKQRYSLDIEVMNYNSFHEDILRLHGRSRLSIGLSISDGLSTSFLETIAMGSLPIQSSTACVDEWVTDGESAFLVAPEDPEEVATAIRRAISDDKLVDNAALINKKIVMRRLNAELLKNEAVNYYFVATGKGNPA